MSSLLSLPTVVWSQILDQLDLHNLKKLRCVCKQTKDMVEKPKYLQNFKITLENVECQVPVLNSSVPWNNFTLALFHKDKVLPEFLTKFGICIQHLEIRRIISSDILNILTELSPKSPKIQTLIIDTVDINPHTFQSPIWAHNFSELKKLQIGGVVNFLDAPKSLFEIILDNCTHRLTHLLIPGLRQNDFSKTMECHYTTLILQPVLNYLKRIEESQRQTNLIIDFTRGVQLSQEILLSLVQICSRLGVKLLHVPIHGFPIDNRSLTISQRHMYEKSVVSIMEIMDKELESNQSRVESNKLNENRYVPQNAQIYVRFKMTARRDENYDGYEIRRPIHSLVIYSPLFPCFRRPYQDFFQTQRPTLQKLEIRSFMGVESRLMKFGQDIAFSFPNLQDLRISHCPCMRTQDFNALINGLPSLEKLIIEDSHLKDEGLLGDDYAHPVILKLQRLKHVELLLCDKLTDECFTEAFRFMNLQTFKWSYDEQKSCQVTFRYGISSLTDGRFKNCVECLEFKVRDSSREEVDAFVNNFKSLKYFNVEIEDWTAPSDSENESESY